MLIAVRCSQCRKRFQTERSRVNRAATASPGRLYCSLVCAGKARREPPRDPIAWKAKKAAYDLIRRNGPLRDEILAEKRERYLLTRDPEKARAERARRKRVYGAHHHSEYCRRR